MHFGAAYYPEYWPPERWKLDANLMQEASFDVIRIGEFAWRIFEPEEGEYTFDRSIGAGLDDAFYEEFVPQVATEGGITGLLKTPKGVSVKSRIVKDRPLLFMMNHTTEPKEISLPRPMQDVLSNRLVQTSFVLPPRRVVALR